MIFRWKIVFVFVAFLFLLFYGCAGKKELFIFRPVEIVEHSVKVDSRGFPENVTLYFCAEDFDPNKAVLIETVNDESDELDFTAVRAIKDTVGVLVFVEDYSGSMQALIGVADSIIKSVAEAFPRLKIGIVRFGKKAVWALPPTSGNKLKSIDLSKLPAPKPNGSSLAQGIFLALDSIPGKLGAIVVVSDASADAGFRLDDALWAAKLREIPMTILQIGGEVNPVLADITRQMDGFFLHSDDPYSLCDVLVGGWTIVYTPAVSDTDGSVHHVVLRWGAKKRIAQYKAPGTPKPKPVIVAKRDDVPIPHELIEGFRVPFLYPNNARLLRVGKAVLDSFIALLPKTNKPIKVVVEGYTCDIGNPRYNLDLSIRRAKVVANYLMRKSRTPLKFEVVGHGEDDPLVPNTSPENRRINRRVEVRVVPQSDEARMSKDGG